MSAPLAVSECRRCGYLARPPRLLCPRCGGGEWDRREAAGGVVTEVTLRRPVFEGEEATRLAAVRSDLGVRIVARAAEELEPGARVALSEEGGAAVARREAGE